jgi:hypothetical protein
MPKDGQKIVREADLIGSSPASSSANGSAEWPPDDRLRRMIQYSRAFVINREVAAYWILRLRGV